MSTCGYFQNFLFTNTFCILVDCPSKYNDGKVCLSLLGTTGAGDESQRWNPHESSLAQVLLSIQSQILDVAEVSFLLSFRLFCLSVL